MSENHEYLSQGGDWAQIVDEAAERGDETVVVNFGPSHPSTHGVMRPVSYTHLTLPTICSV